MEAAVTKIIIRVFTAWAGCSKLTMLLVNNMLFFQHTCTGIVCKNTAIYNKENMRSTHILSAKNTVCFMWPKKLDKTKS